MEKSIVPDEDSMASIVKSCPIQLDRERHIRLDIEALCEAEDALSTLHGRDISVYEVLLQSPIRLQDLCIVVHCGLLHEDQDLTLSKVREILNYAPIPVIYQAVTDAWTKATQAADPLGSGEAAPADPSSTLSTGGSSGPMPVATSGSVSRSSGN